MRRCFDYKERSALCSAAVAVTLLLTGSVWFDLVELERRREAEGVRQG